MRTDQDSNDGNDGKNCRDGEAQTRGGWEKILRKAGIKITHPRKKVVAVLAGADRCLTPEEIHGALVQQAGMSGDPGAGLTSVYRTLNLLTEMGLVRCRELPGEPCRYDLAPQDHRNRIEAVCRRCYRTFCPDEDPGTEGLLNKLHGRLEDLSGFRLQPETLTVYGICSECSRQIRDINIIKRTKNNINKDKEFFMKVALATENSQVAPHFGRCSQYTMADIEGGRIVKKETVENPGHAPGKIPEYLDSLGAKVIVAGGMGRRAQTIFESKGIDWVLGVTGPVDQALEALCAGKLEGGESLCSELGSGESRGDGSHHGSPHGSDHGSCH